MKDVLTSRWPHLFGVQDQPIAIGISEAIRDELALDEEAFRVLRKTISKHVTRIPYLRAIASGKRRMDLDGTLHEVIPGHIAAAQRMMTEKLASNARKKALAVSTKDSPEPVIQTVLKSAPIVVIKKRRLVAAVNG